MKGCTCILFLCLSVLMNGCGHNTRPPGSHPKNSLPDTAKDLVVGGPCDRCKEMFYGGKLPDGSIGSSIAIATSHEPGERMEIQGAVVLKDGITPAGNFVLYIYHTNNEGLYAPSDAQTIVRFNGRLRNWVKTDAQGKFSFSSIRPAPYPTRNIPAHIHIILKEAGKIPYYVDEVWFDDDPLVTKALRQKAEKRGGDLIIHLEKNSRGIWTGNLKITAGLNIPGYP